jgi:hypothetical protein
VIDAVPWRRTAAPAVVLLAFLASAASLTNGFAYDDVHLIVRDARVHSLAGWWEAFGRPYWPAEFGAGLYRPLTSLGFAALWAAGDGRPLPFHLANVALYAACAVAVLRVARLVLPGWPAVVAALLFAVHPVHVEAVANAVGLAELLAALPMLVAVEVYLWARRGGRMSRRAVAVVAALYAAACLAKEHGVLLPALLAAAEATVVADGRPWRARLRSVAPLFALLALLGGGYVLLWRAVPGVTMAAASVAVLNRYPPATRVLTALTLPPEWARLLLWPARLSADYSPPAVGIVESVTASVVAGLAVLAAGAAALVRSWRRAPVLAFGIAWAAISLFLVSNLVLPAGVLLAERTLFMASAGVALAVAAVAGRALAVAPRTARVAAAAAFALVVAAGAARSATRQRVWRDDETLFARTVEDAPFSYRAHWMRAIHLFETGRPGAGEREARIALRLHDGDPALAADLAARYKLAGRCDAAVPLFQSAVALDPARMTTRLLLVECLFAVGLFSEARDAARVGLRIWPHDAGAARAVAVADSLLALRRR